MDNLFLALVWKRPITKFLCPVFLMIAKDCTERLSAVALSVGLIIPRWRVSGHLVPVSFLLRYATEMPWPRLRGKTPFRQRKTGNCYMELLFIGDVFYKQWHLCVLLVFWGHDLLKISNINPRQEARFSPWKKLVPERTAAKMEPWSRSTPKS